MKLGVFTQWIKADSIEELAMKVRSYNLECVVLDSYPGLDINLDDPEPALGERIKQAFAKAGVEIAAIGGYSNLLHQDPEARENVHRRFVGLMKLCQQVGSPMLCSETGTFHPSSDWDWDPANSNEGALTALIETVRPLAETAKKYGVILGFEPYVMNVAYSAERAARFVKELGADNVQLVADPAGFLDKISLTKQEEEIPKAFEAMAPHLGLVHVEDCLPDPNGHFLFKGSGHGMLDYTIFMEQVARTGYKGPLILEHLNEDEVAGAREYVLKHWNEAKKKVESGLV
ncbi:sugar phosphate isomerase/epimerase family protein [Paenibacillus spongiae]|uniref:Sugar phosphate isomerase/epimerase n=1 Tax=Paenibacillus spongiae TaxID=2909671 RepID=A0ABY5SBP9_9BACL|nr:sugar phosphate isomerase/epimerase family protein [Paenibacillus spongiae]UVI30953.1 sugar phosphate isomerase/epimerase [Paenibacillus spongiae]